ncbi:phosphoribosylformylglycinamidine synthase subunit PurS [Roseovarius sp. THAF27]|uniref:phosphoribosylformylglycinamidine synthase subunit PurS n=1 Tax=Roseovarius TaxID=74030 RepID=UPI000CDD460A|nr:MULTISPECIES: phosphoribosylformylglycinamidine synthase subunit PurS [Roseovarius]MBY5988588.1 phosphoribosylformylglycinamidine synthase subunit PurS [Roseovarius atlanticus]MBY6123978.1 phosphoribosylformylglycinamidine synthase subunit PurS [Roseovarius atlanticus]MBY6148473.1 phosphoribosylformylglycinamidine synthase subunit PurS [Roseovarius atlanticus]QFT80768.1 phosphoribosylformylglycinamidine synthase subunit PurS [Roseovarius sp. THAF27]QFT92834.1 phosphoribosylformylglycinamidi
MKARVHVMLKNGVLDPQGEAVRHALGSLGFDGVEGVRQGKIIELDLTETDPGKAKETVTAMCEKLLANTVIESYSVEIA